VKYIIPTVAVALLGIGYALHRDPVKPEIRVESIPGQGEGDGGHLPDRVDMRLSEGTSEKPHHPKGFQKSYETEGVPPSTVGRGPAPSWRKILATMEGALGLKEVPKAEIEGILRRREDQIRDVHGAIRKAGIIDLRDYEWRANLLKAEWFRKVDAFLDPPQHEKFVILVEQGLLNDGLAFTVEPGMTVLE
jgi:hypothetical protein